MLTASTRSSPSPPPTPKLRPRVFSSSRQPRPRLIPKNSYLASASSNADRASDADSETEAEVLGVRVFVDDDAKRPSQSPVRRPLVMTEDPGIRSHTTRAPPPLDIRSTTPATAIRRRTQPASSRIQQRVHKAVFTERLHVPLTFFVRLPLQVVFDVRRGGEALLLIGALYIAAWRLSTQMESPSIVVELLALSFLALIHPALGAIQSPLPAVQSLVLRPHDVRRHPSPPAFGSREREMTFLWTTDARDYRDCADDGAVMSLLFVPIIASTLLHLSLMQQERELSEEGNTIPSHWLVQPLRGLASSLDYLPFAPLQSLILARQSLVHLTTLCSFVLFCHMSASRWSKRLPRSASSPTDASDDWKVRGEGYRTWIYTRFSLAVIIFCLGTHRLGSALGFPIWAALTHFEIATISTAYQFIIYVMVRLARRGFTLGELGLVAQGATALFMESIYLTSARIWPITTEYVKTYRTPTPLLLFQIALIPGAFLTGFFLSPILILSRNLAQKPSYRLRFPDQKTPFRKALAAGFYGGAALIVGGLIGPWTGWCLGPTMMRGGHFTTSFGNPWLWLLTWLTEGSRTWSRPALLVYWGLLACLSLAAWSRQLARARKSGRRVVEVPGGRSGNSNVATTTSTSPKAFLWADTGDAMHSPQTSAFSAPSTTMSHSMTEFLDAADKHVPTLGLNARRKSFHALAVVMFIPGIAFDPAFCHLSFSVAFSLFIFIEYVRYFALYPFSASVHVFMNEFIDDKDGGSAILSHFYLLTGCAAAIWLEGPSKLLEFTGALVLGIGDAVASVIGKRFGKHRWTSDSPKTVEGSAAYTVSVFAGAWFLRAIGASETFSSPRLLLAVALSSVLEALSLQNDNLTLPLYIWALMILLRALDI